MKLFDKALAKLAAIAASTGAGSASLWNLYQPKEPETIKKSK